MVIQGRKVSREDAARLRRYAGVQDMVRYALQAKGVAYSDASPEMIAYLSEEALRIKAEHS
jgi:hypothetical protein